MKTEKNSGTIAFRFRQVLLSSKGLNAQNPSKTAGPHTTGIRLGQRQESKLEYAANKLDKPVADSL